MTGDKSQIVRLLDVFFVGPWMIRAGNKQDDQVLAILGILTIIYNGANFLENRR